MPKKYDIEDPNEFFAQAPVGAPPKQPEIEDPNEFFKQEPIITKKPRQFFEGLQKMAGLGAAMKKTKKLREYDEALGVQEQAMDLFNELMFTAGTRGREKAMEALTKHPARTMTPPPLGVQETRKEGVSTERFTPYMAETVMKPGPVAVPQEIKPKAWSPSLLTHQPPKEELERVKTGLRPEWMTEYVTESQPGVIKPAVSEEKPVVGAIGELLLVPLSTGMGGLQTLYRGVKAFTGKVLEEKAGIPYKGPSAEEVFTPLKKGFLQEEGGVYASDIIKEFATDVMGRELTGGEEIASLLSGLIIDMVVGGRFYPKAGGGPQAENLGRQLNRAFKRAGYKGKVPLEYSELLRVANYPNMADRMSAATGLIARVSKNLPGVSDDFAKLTLDQALKIWGKEGSKFGKRGIMMGEKEVIPLPASMKVPERIKGFRRGGALQGKLPTPLTGLREKVQWGAGASEATIQSMRESNALRNTMAEKSGELVQQMRKQPKQVRREMSKYLDSVAAKTQLGKESEPILGQLAKIEDIVADVEKIIPIGYKAAEKLRTDELVRAKNELLQLQLEIDRLGTKSALLERGREVGPAPIEHLARPVRAGLEEEARQLGKEALKATQRVERLGVPFERAGEQFFPVTGTKALPGGGRAYLIPPKQMPKSEKQVWKTLRDTVKLEKSTMLHQLRLKKRDLQAQLFAKQTGFETNMIKNGFASADDLANRFARFTPEQKDLLKAYRESMDEWFALDQKMGINFQYRQDVVSRLETAISKGRRAKTVATIGAPAGPATKPGFTQHRLGVEQGIAISQQLPPRGQGKWWGKLMPEKWRRRDQFTIDLAEGFADYSVANGIVTSNAYTENLMLERVGKPLTKGKEYIGFDAGGKPILTSHWADLAEKQGFTAYMASMGKHKGKVFFMPAGDVRMLQQMANPEELSKFFRNWRKFSNWWKARATIWRPGFAMRNIFFGNLYQMWLADVNIMKSGSIASKIMQYRWSKAKDGQLAQVMTRKMFGLGKPVSGAEMVRGKSIAQWADEMEKMGVFSSGYAGAELVRPQGRWWNPFGAGFGWTRGVRKVNVVGEDWGHATTYVDRIIKGFTPREAIAAGKKYLFGYNEITPIIQKGRHLLPFLVWPYKNAGLMLSTLLQKPGKLAKYLRAFYGIQDFDALSPEEKFREMTLPPKMVHSGMFRLPFYRGEEESRGYIPTGNLTPPGAMNQLAVHRPGLFLRFLGDMLHPLPKTLWERFGTVPTVGTYGHFGTPYVYHDDATTDAPDFVTDIMGWLKEKGYDGAYNAATELFRPKYAPLMKLQMEAEGRQLGVKDPKKYAEENTPAIGYTVPRWVMYLIQGIDPGVATTVRVLGRDEAYDQLWSFFLGIKPYDLTVERATRWWMQENREFNKELKDIESEEAKHFDIVTEKELEKLGR